MSCSGERNIVSSAPTSDIRSMRMVTNIFFVTVALVVLQQFSEDADILADPFHLQKRPASLSQLNIFFFLSSFPPKNLVSRDGFGRPTLRRSAHSPHSG